MSLLSIVAMAASLAAAGCAQNVPSVDVPACPGVGTIAYDRTVPDLMPFPRTQVDLCYTDDHLQLGFTAFGEVNYYFNASQTTNGDIWEYEVMEAFIHRGSNDPQTYLEFEVNPNNVTYQAFVYNPSKVRAAGAAFDHFFITDLAADSVSATTTLDRPNNIWRSTVQIPLGLFNVDAGTASGTRWRMNFFRTTVSPQTYPNQGLGAWNPPNQASFHMTPFFGHVNFV
ncbi:Uncharacterized protein TCAP_00431 [Tolypocladium capitatum]|uniref:Carbohydrate-binding domain-containing protein n=1 Tax=Tolypocladium capitatum TaxID=45235 RepID=A0A2K3QQ32_9HYPO|nr:Uncharacterized protein TCAP_00431 [Tolypocladium capitatum]